MMLTFEQAHPFVLKDGRRFASLYCAAMTVLNGKDKPGNLLPGCDETTGKEFGMTECRVAATGPLPGITVSEFRKPLSAFAVTGV